ncbi:immunoglobulin domain-containing protein [Pedosphaera parvula]|nr:immunoglobulin domain-containing protein [Pedosphaera parvula]
MRKLLLIICTIVLPWIGGGGALASSPYGLDVREQMGVFLNNHLPPVSVDASGGWVTVPAFPNLTFEDPTFLTRAPGTSRLYVCGRQGIIWFFVNDPSTSNKTVFLNISNRTQGNDDCGLTAMVFHPEFGQPGSTNRGYVYIWYQFSPSPVNPAPNRPDPDTPSYNRLSRFTVPDGSSVADPNSELVLINQFDQNLWHNGGGMLFGEDGFLYLTNGDEGGGDDGYRNTQKINKGLFSGVLRIDVDQNPAKSHPIRRQPQSGVTPPDGWPNSYTANYYIPNDNPFVNADGSVLEEFYAIGFRNPFRMSYDSVSKHIWLADVGDSAREEVDIVVKGGNYQWAYGEGLILGPRDKPATIIGTEVPPIYDYLHSEGNSCIIGGYVYRGLQFAADLSGNYIFGDNYSGRIWAMSYDGSNAPVVTYLCNMPPGLSYNGLSAFGLDEKNELYMCQMGTNGAIYKLARTGADYAQPPAVLSQVGVFTNLSNLATDSGLIPYDVNSPLWSDAALKSRWIAVPNDGAPDSSDEQIGFAATGEWNFPIGTVLVKHFELAVDDTNPNIRKRLETRLLVRGTNGSFYGLTYKWRADNSEADLLTNSLAEDIVITTGSSSRTQRWYYPSRQDCLICHNPNANYVLGVKTRQLNGNYAYPDTGVTDNQLRTWNHLGLFNPSIDETTITNYAAMVHVTNTTASLEARVRSYLDANCAQCHRPNSGIQAYWDARFDTPLASQAITNGAVVADLGIAGARVVARGDVSKSILYTRLNTTGAVEMPPLARNSIDTNAVATVAAWINSLKVLITNTPPTIVAQPQSLILNQGANAAFSVTASGTVPLRYQWLKNSFIIAGATGSSYDIVMAQPGDAAAYSVTVTNMAGSITSATARLTVNIPPNFSMRPHDVTARQGTNATFISSASGTLPLKYQWRHNSLDLAGATDRAITISNVQPADSGNYAVVVTNIAGSITSSSALLTVITPPVVTAQPLNLILSAGENATFSVGSTGTAPLGYQWQFNNTKIVGASSSLLLLTNIQAINAGNYAVVLTNALGSVRSSNATLTVLPVTIPSPPGLVNWWPGDGNAKDIQGTNNGSLKNGTTFTKGIVGQAFNFDGKTNMVSVGILPAAITNTFTIEFWVKPQASRRSTVEANKGITGTTGQRYAIFPRHGASAFGAGHVGAGVSVGTNGLSVFEHTGNYLGSPLVLNTSISGWNHIAVVYQGRRPSVYINGVLKRTGVTSTNIVHPSGDMGGPYGFFSGALDEVGIYNRALTAKEIQSIYNAGTAGLIKGAEFTRIDKMAGGKLQFDLKAKAGGKVRIDISTNLLDWTSATLLTNTNGVVTFIDSSTNAPARFYRSVIVP